MDKIANKALAVAVAAMMTVGAAAADDQQQTAPEIKVTASVPQGFSLAADKARPVYVEFLASKRLTEELRNGMRAAGYNIAEAKDQAAVRYELDGAFQALRPGTGRTAEVRAGEYAEDPKTLKTKTGRGASVMVSFNPLVMLFGTIFSNVGDRAGARDAVNESTTGDPDGKCLAKCEGWVYRQRAVLSLARLDGAEVQRITATASTDAPTLAAAELLGSAGTELAKVTAVPAMGVRP